MNLDIRFDFQRRERLGLIEAIWGQDKSIDQLKRISENIPFVPEKMNGVAK